MDTNFKLKYDNPQEKASVVSKLLFTWTLQLFHKSTKIGLEMLDLYRTLEGDKSGYLGDKLQRNWEIQVAKATLKKSKPSLLRALIKTFWMHYMFHGLIVFFFTVILRSSPPLILSYLLQLFRSEITNDNSAMMYKLGTLLILILIVSIFTFHHSNLGNRIIGMRARIAVSSLIYRKVLKLNQRSLEKATAGQVVNLLSNDVSRFDYDMKVFHFLWIVPFQISIVCFLMWQEVGISALAGIATMIVLSIPVQGYLGKLTGKLRMKVADSTDHRVKLMSEIVTGIRVIKMYAWEKSFEKIVKYVRSTEIDDVTKTSYCRGIYASGLAFIERLSLFLTIICYIMLGKQITASKIFSLASFFNILLVTMATHYPMAISYGAELLVSVERLQEFLLMEEREETTIHTCNEKGVRINDMSASWVSQIPVLKGINMHVLPGTLCAIVGPVGAGKSSLLQVLLGELQATSGDVHLGGEISFSSQEPWLFSSSVCSNIIFGQSYDKLRYEEIVKICALEKDLAQFPLGSATIVGERGISLSGGQRARVNLARAIYRRADIYLLDDPLSAVDTHVGKHLFEECIIKYLKGKTRILVTHQLQYLKEADVIFVLNENYRVRHFTPLAYCSFILCGSSMQGWYIITDKKVPSSYDILRIPSVNGICSDPSSGEVCCNRKTEAQTWNYRVRHFTPLAYCSFILCGSSMQGWYIITDKKVPSSYDILRIPSVNGIYSDPSSGEVYCNRKTEAQTWGRIQAYGTFSELSNSNLEFTKMLVADDESTKKINEEEMKSGLVPNIGSGSSIAPNVLSEMTDSMSTNAAHEEKSGKHFNASPFLEYTKAVGNTYLVITFNILLIAAQAACIAADYWLAYWTDQEEMRHSNTSFILNDTTVDIINIDKLKFGPPSYIYEINETHSNKPISSVLYDSVVVNDVMYHLIKTDVAMYIYGGLIIAAIVVTITRSLLFFKIAMKASQSLHSNMFYSLLKSPMRFFDTNTNGRILNRFSKDIGAIDEMLPRNLLDTINVMLLMCGVLVNVGISNPYMCIAIVIWAGVFLKLYLWFVVIVKEIKHLEGKTKSLVFSHISSSLNGLITIRASNVKETCIKEFDEHQDVHTSAWYLLMTTSTSFGLWLDAICVLFTAIVTFSFIIMHTVVPVSDGMVGLAISQSLIIIGWLQLGMRQSGEVVNQLTSVERVLEYTKNENEGPFETSEDKLPAMPWPNAGLIDFKNLFLKYVSNEPPVLNDLNLTIQPGEKIGIVGRTGAGKSSLVSALFHLAPLEGNIFIDGVDTKELGLTDLRRKISIIPQEPILFSATVRYNLDPFNEFEDSKLWKALEEVELLDAITSLDFMVSEGGINFSLGQRQLICLARAILKNNKILVLDEATANIDHRTDALIQETIRRQFLDCTVLTIAHRLNTIMDSDKVLVMDAGCMVEFDHPHALLQIPDGYFNKMVSHMDPNMSLQLREIALDAFVNRRSTKNEAHI